MDNGQRDEVVPTTQYDALTTDMQALVNVYEKKKKEELAMTYDKGFIAGLTAFAWWKDGVQYVGTCGTTLKDAIERRVQIQEYRNGINR